MINPWKNLSWTWSPNETLSTTECDSVIDEVTTQIPSPEAMAVVNPPMKRSRKKKLKFDDTPRESLNRQFDKIASGQTVSEERQKKVQALHKMEYLKDVDLMASREEWIEERELYAPGCGEFDFEDEKVTVTVTVPPRPRNVRGEGPTLADLGISLAVSHRPAPPLSPIKLSGTALALAAAATPPPQRVASPATAIRPKRLNDIEDIFS